MKANLDRYISHLGHRHPDRSTKKHYASDLNIFIRFMGNKSAREVSVADIDAFVEEQSRQQLKPATINRRLAAISSFFQFLIFEAEEDGWRNPVYRKRHGIREGHHLPRDVKDEVAEALWAVIDDPRDQAMFALMLKAGLRVGEVVALDVARVEGPGVDRLARLRVRGKGNKERIVWLTPQTWMYVHYWLQGRPERKSKALFLNQHKRRLSVAGVQYLLKQYCKKADVQVTCHQLRHTFARRLAEQGMPVESLAKLLGHNDLHTTQRYIDGADLTVRDDFLTAIERLDLASRWKEVHPSEDIAPALDPVQADKAPDPQVIMDKIAYLGADLPDWLRIRLEQHTRRRIPGWTVQQAKKHAYHRHFVLTRVGRWLIQEREWQQLDGLRRVDLLAYVHHRQELGLKPGSIKLELNMFRSFWRGLLEQELVTNGALLLIKVPSRKKERLPRYLQGKELRRLEETLQTETSRNRQYDYFNRAWFYLLAHGGLRVSEALNVRVADCDFHHDRLRIRSGKGNRDRAIPLTPHLKQVLIDYLVVREPSTRDHLLLSRSEPVGYQLVRTRLAKLGKRAGIPGVTPHRLRHTLATQLINEGMPIVSLQKFLGHRDINDTLVYAKVHNETVRQQFNVAMKQIEAIATTVSEPVILEDIDAKSVPLPDI
jgi:site-specific recombinase XerD